MFFCLDAKEPKNQGRPERSAHSPVPAPPSVWLALLTIGLLLLIIFCALCCVMFQPALPAARLY